MHWKLESVIFVIIQTIYQLTARETDHRPTDKKSDRAEDRDRKSF